MSAPPPRRTSRTLPPSHRFPWFPILVLGFAWFVAVAIELSPTGLLGEIAGDLKVSDAAVGSLLTCFALGNAIFILPLTALAIRFASRTALTVVMIVFVASNLEVALAQNIVAADIGRFIGGASYGVICSLFPAVAVRIAGRRYASRAITIVVAATSLGTALGAPLASITGNALGWRVTFIAAAALSLIVGILMTFTVPRGKQALVNTRTLTLMETIRLPGVLRVAVGWALVMLAHFVVLTYIEAYLQQLGIAAYVTSVALFLIGVGGIVGTVFIGRISSRSLFAALITAPAVTALGFAILFLGGHSLPVILGGIALWGIGLDATVVVYQHTVLLTGAKAPETATSVGVLFAQVGFAAGATVGGVTIGLLGVHAIPLVAIAFVVITVLIAVSLRPLIIRAQREAIDADERVTGSAVVAD
jgi:predicted MFS family arabinose efflux permease